MGWDAFSSEYKTGGNVPHPEFQAAHDRVISQGVRADGLLRFGGLDVSTCAQALQEATGENCWTENDWSPAFVEILAARAHWPDVDELEEDEKFGVLNAREFLETCAKIGASIRFSF